ncbi:guanosine-diphosphatase [Geosmithia morbida]|uniref:guanosine-diphosphatase n=1 Tax=Geosmithia morbida TaxID=1094350 RepID=A0A9P4YPN0_9HYPO|nr:guanosine-diphosphatase [Geosmithia morbida]KAF4120818.1 guanosine-diphosphatase [Geosmithia morbida]
MRNSSSFLNKQAIHDPYEKPDRYGETSKGGVFVAKMKDSWASQTSRSRWLKMGAIAMLVICMFYWLAPSGVRLSKQVATTDGQTASDDSYGTDKCTKSYSREKPLVQYVLMIDAGSTGSRIHVYKFNNCGPTPELEHEEFAMTAKEVGGLSNFKDSPVDAAKSLDPLLKVALDSVPEKLQGCAPIAVKATAGLRMIGNEAADAILKEVRRHLEVDYPFPVVSEENDGVVIMPGSEEGVYAWITTNYLLGKIGGPDHSETAAVFDLGGGSTQIVFEPTFKGAADGGMPEKLAEGDHKYELDFGGRKFELYQHSHLGYGLMSARKAIHQTLVADVAASKGATDDTWMSQPIVHPCFSAGMSSEIDVEYDGKNRKFSFVGPSSSSSAQCRNLAEKILQKEAACELAPCSFNGVHQPSLAKTFSHADVYIFSYFYDRTKVIGMPDSFTLREMHDLAGTVCQGKSGWDVFSNIPGAIDELADRPEHCLDLNFMLALLHTGYEMPLEREVKIAKKIKNNELGWCLGASLPLLQTNSGWKCKITQTH